MFKSLIHYILRIILNKSSPKNEPTFNDIIWIFGQYKIIMYYQ